MEIKRHGPPAAPTHRIFTIGARGPELVHKGGGYYEVIFGDAVLGSARGKEKAEALLKEIKNGTL